MVVLYMSVMLSHKLMDNIRGKFGNIISDHTVESGHMHSVLLICPFSPQPNATTPTKVPTPAEVPTPGIYKMINVNSDHSCKCGA